MKPKIKEREEELKRKEERLKKLLSDEAGQLKKKVNRIGKIALAAGIASVMFYWIKNAFFDGEKDGEHVKSKQPQSPSFTQRIGKLITPYATKLLSEYFESEDPKEEKTS